MRTYFRAEGLWDVVSREFTVPQDISNLTPEEQEQLRKNQEKDSQALSRLEAELCHEIQTLSIQTLSIINETVSSSKQAWDILKDKFQETKVKRFGKTQKLWGEYERTKMRESETGREYCLRLIQMVNRLRFYGENNTEKDVVMKILRSCTRKYDLIITIIEECKDVDKMTVADLMSSLECHDLRQMRFKMRDQGNPK
ncbi:hypothetical protein TorRG33x02_284120 [Trema orientale]|uniref:Gag-polypeptide of LTR copia-type n=1 Tax=Trema orientale TaxID=63057 RepID=A0A2P5CIB1_TREOI|nr:hypothetical protein TorRG33x02_284120 [Trema orientale]